MDDHELLGVSPDVSPLSPLLAAAYRREAMRWHPDHNQSKSPAELRDCEARFQRLTEAYGRLRRQGKK